VFFAFIFFIGVFLFATLPTHPVSTSESHVVPSNDLVKCADSPEMWTGREGIRKRCVGGWVE